MNAMKDFDRTVLELLEGLFDEGEIETLFFWSDPGNPSQDHAVKVVHNATGAEAVSNDFESQIRNKSLALIRLLETLKSR
jgi:hypothetical protein